ncbi:MAG TPA: hypothetical protein VKH46_05510 [Thermoanaerobaculia bacterium]|jgi:hypothetical protein|nr:hypothetical protein [Thermoanaerobaculia bacterium]
MSHDPLLDKIHEVRNLLTAFKNALVSQKRFNDQTASIFWGEDKAFWTFQAEHDRLKHQGISADSRQRLLVFLEKKAAQWERLCRLAESGVPIENDFLEREG